MKIGIISDTHDNAVNLIKAVKIFNKRKVDLVIHCGDWVSPFMPDFCKSLKCKIISIFGNNEGDKIRFLKRKFINKWNIEFNDKAVEMEIDKKKIMVYHGDVKPILKSLIAAQEYDIVLSGHTHAPVNIIVGRTLHINPGSTSGLCESKIIKNKSIAIYDSAKNKAEIIYF